uniref:DAGKc domain-containing protein n=1 Tax=Heterorhabditis bacteriophora TaxID=37862 RepID=A0A1I7WHL6_HETBA
METEGTSKIRNRPNNIIVFINPFGGKGKAQKIFQDKVDTFFRLTPGLNFEVILTERANHAKDYIIDMPVSKWQSIDGLHQNVTTKGVKHAVIWLLFCSSSFLDELVYILVLYSVRNHQSRAHQRAVIFNVKSWEKLRPQNGRLNLLILLPIVSQFRATNIVTALRCRSYEVGIETRDRFRSGAKRRLPFPRILYWQTRLLECSSTIISAFGP